MDDEHVLALVEAVHGAHFDTVHGFAANAALVDDVGQLSILSADRSAAFITASSWCPALWLKMSAEETSILGLDRNAKQSAFGG
jgi:hypothetical protein